MSAVGTRVLTDANVLYSRTLRDWIFLLNLTTENQLFRVTYTVDILSETIRSLRRNTGLDGGQLTRISDKIVANMDERIEDYPNRDDSPCTDPFDAHVHAAAVAGRVNLLVTHDSGFTELDHTVRDGLPYEIYSPDDFFVLVADSSPIAVRDATERQIRHFRQTDLHEKLAVAGCPEFSDYIHAVCKELALRG